MGRHAAEIPKAESGILDQAAPTIADRARADKPAGDDRHSSGSAERAPERVGVVALVGDHEPCETYAVQKLGSRPPVGDVAERLEERIRSADNVR